MEDQKLSEHVTLFDLTHTNTESLQEQNHILTPELIQTARNLAGLIEAVQEILTCPVKVCSAYRCKALNDAVGSSDRSQHLKFEAADLVPFGMDVGDAFRILWKSVKEGKLMVGQLIFETAERSYGVVSWIHISLGTPWRAQERCNQVLRMEHGKYTTLS